MAELTLHFRSRDLIVFAFAMGSTMAGEWISAPTAITSWLGSEGDEGLNEKTCSHVLRVGTHMFLPLRLNLLAILFAALGSNGPSQMPVISCGLWTKILQSSNTLRLNMHTQSFIIPVNPFACATMWDDIAQSRLAGAALSRRADSLANRALPWTITVLGRSGSSPPSLMILDMETLSLGPRAFARV